MAADTAFGRPHELDQVLCVLGRDLSLNSPESLLHLQAGAKKQKVGFLQPANLVLGDSGSAQSHQVESARSEIEIRAQPFLPGLESALEDSEVSEIMINGPANV